MDMSWTCKCDQCYWLLEKKKRKRIYSFSISNFLKIRSSIYFIKKKIVSIEKEMSVPPNAETLSTTFLMVNSIFQR